MSGRTALVTGATSGLGRAVAVELARGGWRLVLVARSATALGSVAEDLRALGAPCVAVAAADVRDACRLQGAVEQALLEASGQPTLDLVVHAAGVLRLAALAATTDADLDDCFQTNVVGSVHVAQACLPALAAARGRLVLIVSITGQLALPGGFGAYAASKWGLRGWAETVRPELAARGVSLTLAFPSILDTPMVRDAGSLPAVYRTFPWHAPETAARRLLRDAESRRKESYVTLADRLAAVAARLVPRTFTRALHARIALAPGGRGASA